jgi:hypothetical protein
MDSAKNKNQGGFKMHYKAIAGFLLTAASLSLAAYSQTSAGMVSPQTSGAPWRGCSNQTMKGSWGTTIEGTVVGPNILFRGLALQYFDGKGHITQVDHVVNDGLAPAAEWTPGTGTYTVNPDCTGSAVINSGSTPAPFTLHFILADNGNRWLQVVDSNAVLAIGHRIN